MYFELTGFPTVLPCGTFDRVADNIAAIAGHIGADQRQERYGVGKASQRYADFKAVPEHGRAGVLGVEKGADAVEVRAAYRRLVKKVHPDAGGSAEAFRSVRIAYE